MNISQPNRMDRQQDVSGLTGLNNGDIMYYSGGNWIHLDRPGLSGNLRNTAAGVLSWSPTAIPTNSYKTWVPTSGQDTVAGGASDTMNLLSENGTMKMTGSNIGFGTDTMHFEVDLAANFDWTGSHVLSKLVHTLSGLDITLPSAGTMKPVFIVDSAANDPGLYFDRPFASIGQVYLGDTSTSYHLFDILGSGAGNITAGSNNAELFYQASTNTLSLADGGGAFVASNMTTTQRNAMTPANGWIIYNTTTNQMEGYINGGWAAM